MSKLQNILILPVKGREGTMQFLTILSTLNILMVTTIILITLFIAQLYMLSTIFSTLHTLQEKLLLLTSA